MLLNEESRVDAFIKGLRSKQYRSHFLITKPSTMEEVRRTAIHITRKGHWIHTTSSSYCESDSDPDFSSSDSVSSMEKDFIKTKHSSHSKKKHASISQKDKRLGTSHPAATSNSKQEINRLIKQFEEMKILLAEAVTKVNRLEQSKNNCKNCKSSIHTTPNCNQPCKICQGSLDIHVFWKCPNYNIAGNRSNPSIPVANTTNPSNGIEHVILEDDDEFDPFSKTLEDLCKSSMLKYQ